MCQLILVEGGHPFYLYICDFWDISFIYTQDNFLSPDFGPVKCASLSLLELHRTGLKEFNPPAADKCLKSKKERIRRYRRYVYEAGSLNQPKKGNVKVIKDKVLEKERGKEFELSRSDRFRYRTHYFSDSGIIGSKEFVTRHYRRFKDLFMSKNEKIPRPVAGLDGMYSLKRLSEFL
jgi:hypothetical protein